MKKISTDNKTVLSRRNFLLTSSSVAAATLISSVPVFAKNDVKNSSKTSSKLGTRKLGNLEVSSIGFGAQKTCRKFDTTVPNRAEIIDIIRTAYDNGVTFFDAAEVYGPFEVEKILGEGLSPIRDKVKITTKFGFDVDPITAKRNGLNSRPEHIKAVVERMLKRLQTDRIDLLYQHRVDPQVPIEDVAGAVKDLMKEGKVIHWGLSEMGLNTLRRAHKELPVTAVQNEYSMLYRGVEKNNVLNTCEELGIGFVPWAPLGAQFLTGWFDEKTRFAKGDFRGLEPRFSPENLALNMPLVELVNQWAELKSCYPSQIALAWLLAQKDFIVPIPCTTNKTHLLQNIGAVNVQFSADELAQLTKSINEIKIHGGRLPDFVQVRSDVEAPLKK